MHGRVSDSQSEHRRLHTVIQVEDTSQGPVQLKKVVLSKVQFFLVLLKCLF